MSERISLVDCTHKFEFEELDEEMRLIEKICDQQVRMICSKCLHLFTFDTEKAADPRLRQIFIRRPRDRSGSGFSSSIKKVAVRKAVQL